MIWAAMEQAQRQQPEKIRALGVSNFDAQALGELAKTAVRRYVFATEWHELDCR